MVSETGDHKDENPAKENSNAWQDALLAIKLVASAEFANKPPFLGICVQAAAGPVLETWLKLLEAEVSATRLVQVPAHIDLDRLVGGLDLAATLASGRKVAQEGLLSKADGKFLVLKNTHSMEPEIIASILAAMDQQKVLIERDGLSETMPSRFVVIVVQDPEESMPSSLSDRLAIHIDLQDIDIRQAQTNIQLEEKPLCVAVSDFIPDTNTISAIAELASAFGLTSLRPAQQALKTALEHAALQGREFINQEDVSTALRLSLMPRALTFPVEEDVLEEPEAAPQEAENQIDAQDENTFDEEMGELADLSIDAVLANLPDGLLDDLAQQKRTAPKPSGVGRAGSNNANFKRGRPIASVRGKPAANKRMDILATLRASAPWQKIRKENVAADRATHFQIRSEDFHIRRFKKPAESTTIFVVDASGSTAVNRLGEAKGAIELVLSESYARRDHVAMIAMKGIEAEVILPTTRSLVLAKRTLSGLTGGGGTPLADGLRKALQLADDEKRKCRVPSIIVLTDGSANIDLQGNPGRRQAQLDALEMARHIASSEHPVLVIDVSKLVGKQAKEIAHACQSQYVGMPFANATSISNAVQASRSSASGV